MATLVALPTLMPDAANGRVTPARIAAVVRYTPDERVFYPTRMRRATQHVASEADGVRSMMRLLDFFTSTRRPAAGTPPISAHDLREGLMALNRPSAPYVLRDGQDENVDVIAEWKIVDAQWYEIFAKAGLSKTFKIYLKLRPEEHTVRASDREYAIEWRAGVPSLSFAASAFRGQKQEIQFGTAYAFTETLQPGEVYNYRFDTRELKGPIQQVVTDGGWTYKGVAFGKL